MYGIIGLALRSKFFVKILNAGNVGTFKIKQHVTAGKFIKHSVEK